MSPSAGGSNGTPLRMRFPMRARTLPGPTFTKEGAPASCMAMTVSRQRTGLVRAVASSSRTSVNGAALAPEKTVNLGSESSTSSSAARNGATAGSMAGEWNAPATSRRMTRVPRSCAAASVLSRASRLPDSTTWPGALSLATVTPPSAAIACASSSEAPTSASIEPLRASPIRRPRRTTSSRASSRLSTPAATSAASSPSEWPAPALGCRSSASQPVTEAQKMAGCAKRVFSSTRAKGSSPTSSVTRSSRSGARWATRSRISGVWLAWPGKSAAGCVALLTLAPSPTPMTGHTLPGRLPPGQGVTHPRLRDQAQTLGLLHGLGAVADAQLAIQRRRVLLDRVRREIQRRRDLAVGGSRGDGLDHLALTLGQRRSRGRLVRLEDGHAQPDHPHRPGDVGRRPVLGDEPGRAGRLGGVGRDAPRPGDEQHVQARVLRQQLRADLRARLLADEQVDERDVRVVALGEGERLGGVAGRQAALHPGLLAEHEPQAPVDHLVVVHDEHPQPAPLAAGRGAAEARRVEVRPGQPAPPGAPATARARARRTPRSRRPAAPRARPGAAPCPTGAGAPARRR